MLSVKELLEKAATIERFEYSPLGSGLNKQTLYFLKKLYGFNKKNTDKAKTC